MSTRALYLANLAAFYQAASKLLDEWPEDHDVNGYPSGFASFEEVHAEIAGWVGEERAADRSRRADLLGGVGVFVGARVRFVEELYVYPFVTIDEGETGTVHVVDAERGWVEIQLDKPHESLDEWSNRVHFGDDGAIDLATLAECVEVL